MESYKKSDKRLSEKKKINHIENEDDWNEVEKFLNDVSGDKNE